jgi:hypothetical protein
MNKFLILKVGHIAACRTGGIPAIKGPNIRKNSYWPGRDLRSG